MLSKAPCKQFLDYWAKSRSSLLPSIDSLGRACSPKSLDLPYLTNVLACWLRNKNSYSLLRSRLSRVDKLTLVLAIERISNCSLKRSTAISYNSMPRSRLQTDLLKQRLKNHEFFNRLIRFDSSASSSQSDYSSTKDDWSIEHFFLIFSLLSVFDSVLTGSSANNSRENIF